MSPTAFLAGATLALTLVAAGAPISARAQGVERPRRASSSYDSAYQIGYDEGYRGGYDRGVQSVQDGKSNSPNDYKEYRKGDEGYNDTVGSREDYKLGYRAGFEQGIQDGYSGVAYGSRPGVDRVRVPATDGERPGGPVLRRDDGQNTSGQGTDDPYGSDPNGGVQPGAAGVPSARRVGSDTILVIELETPITTRHSKVGDRFSARVLDPAVYADATVEGYIAKLERPGKLSGKGEIVLEFQQIVFPDGYGEPLQAQVEEVIGYQTGTPRAGGNGPLDKAPWDWGKKGDRNDDIDAQAGDEGQIEGQSSKKRDAAVIGGSAATGAILGGILGGGSGAAVGAVIGAATGGGAVAGSRGHDIDLQPGVRMRIRTGQGVSN